MKYAELANAGVHLQPVYEPGKSIESVAREHGLNPAQIAKLASNENPYGPSPKALEAAQVAIKQAHIYPDGACLELRSAIAKVRAIDKGAIIVGNGSNEIIELLGHVFLRPGLEVVMGSQAFVVYKLVTKLFGATPVEVPMYNYGHDLKAMRAAVTSKTRLLFVASPNNPTGVANKEADLNSLAESLPEHVILCLDEAYAEYVETAPNLCALIEAGRKIICLRTFSKIYGLGGLRIGYGYGDLELISLLQRVRQPFNVNSAAQAAAIASLEDHDFVKRCMLANNEGRRQLADGMQTLGYTTVGGEANFVLSNVGDGNWFFLELQKRGIIVRPLVSYGMPAYVRITIGTDLENKILLNAASEVAKSRKENS